MKITNSLIEISQLQELLGYSDESGFRSTKEWCKEHRVPISKLGKSRYVHAWTVEIAFLRILGEDADNNGLPGTELIGAISNDDKVEFARLFNSPVDADSVENYTTPRNSEKQGEIETMDDLLNSYNTKAG